MVSDDNFLFYMSECNNGSYGLSCNQTCGYCMQSSECHHITGECSDYCQAGYQGTMCDTGSIYFLTY